MLASNQIKIEDIIRDLDKQLKENQQDLQLLALLSDEISFQIPPIIRFENLSYCKMSYIPINKLQEMQYKSLLYISGDGNCFYRAFMIDFLIQSFTTQNITKIQNLILSVYSLEHIEFKINPQQQNLDPKFQKCVKLIFLSNLLKWYQELLNQMKQPNNPPQKSIAQIIFDNYKDNYTLDMCSVIICKNLILITFNNIQEDINSSSICHIDDETKKEVPELLTVYGQFAQSFCISCTPQTFNCRLSTVLVNARQKDVKDFKFGHNKQEYLNEQEINLLLLNQHYYILFKLSAEEIKIKNYDSSQFQQTMNQSVILQNQFIKNQEVQSNGVQKQIKCNTCNNEDAIEYENGYQCLRCISNQINNQNNNNINFNQQFDLENTIIINAQKQTQMLNNNVKPQKNEKAELEKKLLTYHPKNTCSECKKSDIVVYDIGNKWYCHGCIEFIQTHKNQLIEMKEAFLLIKQGRVQKIDRITQNSLGSGCQNCKKQNIELFENYCMQCIEKISFEETQQKYRNLSQNNKLQQNQQFNKSISQQQQQQYQLLQNKDIQLNQQPTQYSQGNINTQQQNFINNQQQQVQQQQQQNQQGQQINKNQILFNPLQQLAMNSKYKLEQQQQQQQQQYQQQNQQLNQYQQQYLNQQQQQQLNQQQQQLNQQQFGQQTIQKQQLLLNNEKNNQVQFNFQKQQLIQQNNNQQQHKYSSLQQPINNYPQSFQNQQQQNKLQINEQIPQNQYFQAQPIQNQSKFLSQQSNSLNQMIQYNQDQPISEQQIQVQRQNQQLYSNQQLFNLQQNTFPLAAPRQVNPQQEIPSTQNNLVNQIQRQNNNQYPTTHPQISNEQFSNNDLQLNQQSTFYLQYPQSFINQQNQLEQYQQQQKQQEQQSLNSQQQQMSKPISQTKLKPFLKVNELTQQDKDYFEKMEKLGQVFQFKKQNQSK